ncbi:hypothetical protein ACJROX_08040 [Pseudalkalibacillus sp. A8]|uniref:hypothetical protein n=1 Tax=Pseudalkalibacillus sp. A8 TaxID=3382641 RepID=UPI0038B66F3A
MMITLNWGRRLLIWLFVIVFFLFDHPLDHFPTAAFSYTWGFVVLTKSFDFLYTFSEKRMETIFHSLLIGILIGACITSLQVQPIDVRLVGDLFFALSPLFLFRNVLSVKNRQCHVEDIKT